jgi:tripartite-type tricarboxylate transporter receptor subunit TctC
MRIIERRIILKSAAGLLLTGRFSRAFAETAWPTRPVRFIVPLAAGGALDFAARQCSGPLSRILNQQVFVENRTGAGGTIGMDTAMKAPSDGYTFLFANDNIAIAPHILKLPYDYTREMLPVITVSKQPLAFAVNQSLPVRSVAELVDYVRKNPGLGFASSGVGSNQHVLGAWFAREANIVLQHVPYRGAGQAVTDLVAGSVKFGILGPTALLPHVQTGALVIIAQTGAKGSAALPAVPTLVEVGYKEIVLDSWFGLFAPAGTPAEIIMALNGATAKALDDPELRATFANATLDAIGGSPGELATLARSESDKYARLVKELNIAAE